VRVPGFTCLVTASRPILYSPWSRYNANTITGVDASANASRIANGSVRARTAAGVSRSVVHNRPSQCSLVRTHLGVGAVYEVELPTLTLAKRLIKYGRN
jgi:hypothetical protein